MSATRSVDCGFRCSQVTTNAIVGPVHKVHFILRFDTDSSRWEDKEAELMSELQSKLDSSNVEINPLFR